MRIFIVLASWAFLSGPAFAKSLEIGLSHGRAVPSAPSYSPDVKGQLEQANLLREQNHWKEYIRSLENLLMVHKTDINVRIALGNAFLDTQQYDRAFQLFSSLPSEHTSLPAASTGLALSAVMAEQSPDPIKTLLDALKNDKSDARVWNALGKLYDKQEKWLEAQEFYISAMQTGNNIPNAINNMGVSFLMQNRFERAKEKFKQASLIAPEMEHYQNNLSLAYFMSGDVSGGLRARKSVSADLLLDAGHFAEKYNKPDVAVCLYKQAIEKSPTYFPAGEKRLETLRLSHTSYVDCENL